jgi:hypothetical protein
MLLAFDIEGVVAALFGTSFQIEEFAFPGHIVASGILPWRQVIQGLPAVPIGESAGTGFGMTGVHGAEIFVNAVGFCTGYTFARLTSISVEAGVIVFTGCAVCHHGGATRSALLGFVANAP